MLNLLALNLRAYAVVDKIALLCEDSKCCLPGEAAGGWGPGLEELAKKDDAAEVVGVVGGERDELVAHGHDSCGSAGA